MSWQMLFSGRAWKSLGPTRKSGTISVMFWKRRKTSPRRSSSSRVPPAHNRSVRKKQRASNFARQGVRSTNNTAVIENSSSVGWHWSMEQRGPHSERLKPHRGGGNGVADRQGHAAAAKSWTALSSSHRSGTSQCFPQFGYHYGKSKFNFL